MERKPSISDLQFLEDERESLRLALDEMEIENQKLAGRYCELIILSCYTVGVITSEYIQIQLNCFVTNKRCIGNSIQTPFLPNRCWMLV